MELTIVEIKFCTFFDGELSPKTWSEFIVYTAVIFGGHVD